MSKISLTDFVDIVAAAGTSKASKTKQILTRDEYHPSRDFYRPLREKIIDLHRTDQPREKIKEILSVVAPKKHDSYAEIIAGYLGWHGKKKFGWFEPPSAIYSKHGIDISVNPELGLIHNGKPHLIKLYFKSPELSKNKADIILALMKMCLFSKSKKDVIMSVLDIRRKKLYTPTVEIPMIDATVIAELAYISSFEQALLV